MGIQLCLMDRHSGLAPLATFTPSLQVHWDCVPFVSGLTCENKHNPKTRLVSVDRVVGPFLPRSLGVHKGRGVSELNGGSPAYILAQQGCGRPGYVWTQLTELLLWGCPISCLSHLARGVPKGNQQTSTIEQSVLESTCLCGT